jgi:hypothetical protein
MSVEKKTQTNVSKPCRFFMSPTWKNLSVFTLTVSASK